MGDHLKTTKYCKLLGAGRSDNKQSLVNNTKNKDKLKKKIYIYIYRSSAQRLHSKLADK